MELKIQTLKPTDTNGGEQIHKFSRPNIYFCHYMQITGFLFIW